MHRCIGPLLSFGGKFKGTAFLISEDTAVTAAHCIYSHDLKSYSFDTKFYPGLYGSLKGHSFYNIERCYAPKEYLSEENKNNPLYDYAFLKLSGSIKYEKYLKLGDFDDYNGPISIYGYPGSKYHYNG